MKCTTKPYWTGTLTVNGDGTYKTAPVKLAKAGYYTYRESIAESDATTAATTTCGETIETSFAYGDAEGDDDRLARRRAAGLEDRGRDQRHRARPDRRRRSRSRSSGPSAHVRRSAAAASRTGPGSLTAHGDGTVKSKAVAVRQVGFYTYREHVVGTDLVASATTECAVTAETSLARPLIVTGRGDVRTHAAASSNEWPPPRARRARVPRHRRAGDPPSAST